MARQHPCPQMSIPISIKIYQQLLGASQDTGFNKEDWEIAAEAIEQWMRRHHPDAIAMNAAAGYQWKALFLPDGTLLRTVFGGKNHHCLVEGDQIVYQGHSVSPSGFINAVGGIRRNAWRCTWILLPDRKDWQLADALRTPARPRLARKPKPVIAPAPVTQAAPELASDPVAPEAAPIHAHYAAHGQGAPSSRVERRNRQLANRVAPALHGSPSGPAYQRDADAHMGSLLRQGMLELLDRIANMDGRPR